MAKQRGSKGSETRDRATGASEREAASPEHDSAKDPSLVDQAALGNAVVQARMESGEGLAAQGPGLDVVAEVAAPMVQRAMATLQLDAADAERHARRIEILEQSRLSEREALVDQLHGDETARQTVDGLLDTHFGGHDAETRWAVDAVLDAVGRSLGGEGSGRAWTDADGALELSEQVGSGSLDSRAQAMIADLASARAPEAGRQAATSDVGSATAQLVRSLALMVLLDEEEEEEELEGPWGDVELS